MMNETLNRKIGSVHNLLYMNTVTLKINEIVKEKTTENVGLDDKTFILVNDINQMITLIIRNTFMLNKFTTIDEIISSLETLHIDKCMIEKICDTLCTNEGLLIKFVNTNKVGYKLNSKIYI